MKKIWVPLFVLLLLPASYSEQRPAERLETAQPPFDDSIQYQTQEPEEPTLYFPDYVDGGGWSVQLALSNVDPDTVAEVVVEVYDQDGGSIVDLFDTGMTFEIPPLGSRVLKSSGTGAIRRGWIQVRIGTDSVSGLLTYREGTTGIEVSVEPAELGDRFALFVEESADVGAGVAVFKPEAPPSIQLRVRDDEGDDPLDGAFVSRGNFHQDALTLPEWFTAEGIEKEFPSDFRGLLLLQTEDESPFAPLGLRFGKRNQSLSSVPAIRDETPEPTETTLYFPDYVDGSGWSVQLALSNVDAENAADIRVKVFDQPGQRVSDLFDSESAFEIPSLGNRVLRSAGAGSIRRGWIEVESDSASVSGLLTYRQSETGVEVSVKPVELGNQFALFVEESSTIGAGVAIFKPDASPKVELRIRDEEGNDPLNGVFIPRGDFHQDALTLPEWLAVVNAGFLSDFRGLLFIRSEDDSQFAPLGLRFGKTNSSLSSVPAIRIRDEGGTGGQAPAPTATLSVAPSLINFGESATLTWSSTNAERVEITPDLGAVPAAGSRKVSPRTTTTYRITVRGADGQTRTASVTVRVAVVVVSQQDALTALYQSTGGPDWYDSGSWGTSRPLRDWHGITVDARGRVTELNLYRNNLGGPIPPELGSLTSLRELDLGDNGLTGSIPSEFGNLTNLRDLLLGRNGLAGSIPPELGDLTRLTELRLEGNDLTGPIPPELGNLTNLTELNLGQNDLTGPIPPELGNLTNLTELNLSGNSGMAGILQSELTGLGRLETLLAGETDLCAPSNPDFQAWLEGIYRLRVATCGSDSAAFAYLTQAVQSREYPVPLVAGEEALLRVFVTAASPTTAGIPPVRAWFYVNGTEIHVADIPARTAALPSEVYEGDLSRSSNAEIPGEIIRPGLEMAVDIDPEGTLDPGLVTASRIPDTGRMAVDVREMPALHLTVIPFLWSANPHRAVVETAEAMEADPEGHELLWNTRTLLPIKDLEVTAHAPVMTSTSPDEYFPLLGETEAIRAMEGGSGHYMGTMSNPGKVGRAGLATIGGRAFISRLNPFTIPHELGHNLSLYHAPCGGAGGPDPAFPSPGGSMGAWGYDFRYGGTLASPSRPDVMGYCDPAWISDYHFANALRFRLFDEGPPRPASLIAQEAKSLLIWGGMDAEGQLFLNPSFVVDAPSKLPRATGEHRITGRSGSGDELFSVGFTMPEVADGDGSSSFAFVLPVEPGWAISLASITLSGPGGSVTLDSDTDIPRFILVDPNTRQVRGILRDLPQAGASALVHQAGTDSLDVLFSRGIPAAAAWGP